MISWLKAVRVRFLGSWETVRQSYGFVPALLAVMASLLAAALVLTERTHEAEWLAKVPWLGTLSAESCRSILQAIAGSSITVAGTVFSVMIVALTLASSQFGPRLLRIFLRDRGNQISLGVFVSTFLYSLLVLASVRADHVPRVATSGAVGLAVLSVAVLVFVLHRASTTIQASYLVAAVFEEIEEQVCALDLLEEDPGRGAAESSRRRAARREFDEVVARATSTIVLSGDLQQGYLRAVQLDSLLSLAATEDLVIELLFPPGAYLYPGSPVARLHRRPTVGAGAAEVEPGSENRDDSGAVEAVRTSLVLGPHRSAVQDTAFLLEQLVEMAVRALSPGINDPRTAVLCVHRLGGALCLMAHRQLETSERRDDDDVLRVWRPVAELGELCYRSFAPIRLAGIGQPEVMQALFEALQQMAYHVTRARGAACDDRLALEALAEDSWQHFASAGGLSEADRDAVAHTYDRLQEAFTLLARRGGDPAAAATAAKFVPAVTRQ